MYKFSKIIHTTLKKRKVKSMKRDYVYVIALILCILGVIWGIMGLLNTAYQTQEAKTNDSIQELYENRTTVTTAVEEEKVSPNTDFALKKYYDECNHFDYEEVELPIELVNLTRQEVEDYYDDWEIAEFSKDKLVLGKEINGYCNQHFLIRLDDDVVKVYRFGTLGELEEYENTEIARDYLPEEDIENLEEGITVYGEGKLSSVLEDFE